MVLKSMLKAAICATLLMGASAVQAAPVFVGSWQVDSGPGWPGGPPAYTGQEAAAAIFGGSASDYSISTIGPDTSNINFSAWVSTWGGACGGTYPCGTVVADDFSISTAGQYLTPGDTSAYVSDWARGDQYINYAFTGADRPVRDTGVPEPMTLSLVGFGLAGAALANRKKKNA